MKKIKLLLLLLMLTAASAYSQLQQIKIVSFTVKNQLPAVIDNWGNTPGSLLLVAQLPPNVSVKGIRLMVQIKGSGAIICGNNLAGGMPVDEFTTRTFSANELTSTLQGCHDLKEGSYSICVQFYNVDRVAISNEVCKEFSVEAQNIEYTPPTLINPENGKVFTEAELSRPVTFRWTPLVPKPQQPVTYRLKVWQLMQGQNGTQAIRSNPPIVTKDVDNITQTVISSGIYNGPCKPPYMCDFIWVVQALNREGKPIGKNEGTSDPYTFKVETNTAIYTAPQLVSPNDGKAFGQNEMSAPVFFRWTPLVPKPQTVIYRLKIWQLMQGQNGTQAMRTNPPIVTKDVDNITQAAVTGIYTGPCKPPYLCDFVWQVQAVDREDHPIGSNEGKSEVWSFKVTENGVTTCSPPKLTEPVDGRKFQPEGTKGVRFSWGPVLPKSQEPVTYRLKVWQLMQGQNGTQAMRSNQPIVTKDVDNVTEITVDNIYTGPCKPPYMCDFIWEVQALNREGKPACVTNEGKSEAFTFKVEDNAVTECSPPKLAEPADGKKLKPEDAKNVKFSWGPVVPKSQESVTYRLKVWQLMQGQNGQQAMRSNKPIVEKNVIDLTETTVNGIYTGPCKPPYMCDFVWEVQALNRDGKPACAKNEGKSEVFNFKIQNNIDIQIDSLKVGCCEKGVQTIYIKVKNNLASSVKVVAVKYKVNGAGPAINLSPISPTLPQTIAGNGFVVFTGQIECNPAINFLKFLVDAEDVADPDNKETEVKSDTLNCICTACKDIKIQPNEKDKPTITSTAITQNLSFVTGPGKVKSVKMDLVWFEFVPESDDCLVCTTPSSQMGNFSSGTLNGVGGSGGGTHGLVWNFSPPKDMNGGVPLQYSISYPKMVACCGAKAKWCIRYTVTYENCITCSVVVCNYEASIKGCNK